MTRLSTLVLCGALAGCAGAPADDAEDPVVVLEGAPLAAALGGAAQTAPRAFLRLRVLSQAATETTLEVSTSVDGRTFTPFAPLATEPEAVMDDEADDPMPAEAEPVALAASDEPVEGFDAEETEPETEVAAAVTQVGVLALTEPAAHFRVRAAGAAVPHYLAVELDADADVADDDLIADGEIDLPDGVSSQSAALSSFRVYRFDLGRVTKPWLWLLRSARKAGWSGRLAGPRTGLRTYAQQNSLWRAYQNGTGAPAFPPWGPSRHMTRNVKRLGRWAMAVDTQDAPRLERIARRRGVSLNRPYGREPWHVEARRAFNAR